MKVFNGFGVQGWLVVFHQPVRCFHTSEFFVWILQKIQKKEQNNTTLSWSEIFFVEFTECRNALGILSPQDTFLFQI